MEGNLTYLSSGGGFEDVLEDYTSLTPNTSAAYDYMDFYTDLDINCGLGHIPAFASTFFPVLYSLLFVTGLVGNALVIWILTLRKVKAVADMYLLNLAISDLLFVFSLPFLVQYSIVSQWTFGNAMCKIISSAYFIGFYSSAFFITILSIDRYLAIVQSVHALQIRTPAHGLLTSLLLWALAILAATPDLVFFQAMNENNWTKCVPHYPGSDNGWKIFSNFEVNILGWLIPAAILTFCYHSILKNLPKCHTHNKYKAMKLVFIVVIVFFLFWTPLNVTLFLNSLRYMYILDDCHTSQRLDLAMELAEAFSFIHCCLNPFIYAFVGQKFKKQLHEAFSRYTRFLSACKGGFDGHSLEKHSSLHTKSSQLSFAGTAF
ncbi:C-C chemokine receptor type 8-like [Colius striatus]|uniref:C-C chemokine receptor type 8-like n=1 Tax=Colius striatus TaxID=57412 RepID=UPI002B1DD973|nr:C-C chemokine receptor type 8-like [Colius striatus]